jgi:hypothetical protein
MFIVTNCGKYELEDNERSLTLLENDADLAWLEYQSSENVSIEKLQPSGYFIASIYVEGWFNGLNGAEWSSGHHEKRYSDTLSGLNQLIGEIYE